MLNLTTQETLIAVFILLLIFTIIGTIFRRFLKFVISIALIIITFFVSTCWLPGKIIGLLNGDIKTDEIVHEVSERYEETGLPKPNIKITEPDKIDWSLQGWQNSYESLSGKIQGNPSIIIEGNR